MPQKHTPPKHQLDFTAGQLSLLIDAGGFWRLTPEGGAADTPAEVWFSPWAPLPIEVPRGPYAVPNWTILRRVEIGLLQLKRRSDEQ
ncbi:hypothetical protein [Streptomyces sp. x-80]|uniref:hypothetical protein n=1 Tax=Streptomyces sp. x-80 TaxID=2789282 RepID=UPI00397F5561